jgi:hypothetical protein
LSCSGKLSALGANTERALREFVARHAQRDLFKPEVDFLVDDLRTGAEVATAGLILQELLHGFNGPKARAAIVERFAALPLLVQDSRELADAAARPSK